MKIAAIIQARVGSTRLPGKALRPIAGETMLARVVQRTQRATLLDQIIVATTTAVSDDDIVAECQRLGVPYFRGCEEDVLDRYFRAAQAFAVDVIVRITSDCPLIEPVVGDQVIALQRRTQADYASNTLSRTFPRGLDVEVFPMMSLERVWQLAREPYQRSHVTPYFYHNPAQFHLAGLTADADYSHYRWTVDTMADWQLVTAVYEHFAPRVDFTWQEVLHLLQQRPDLATINAAVQQKDLQQG
jgi:spore coat polysaccharide biosynthesis protein SpsF